MDKIRKSTLYKLYFTTKYETVIHYPHVLNLDISDYYIKVVSPISYRDVRGKFKNMFLDAFNLDYDQWEYFYAREAAADIATSGELICIDTDVWVKPLWS